MIVDASHRFRHRRMDSACEHIVREFWPRLEPRFAPSPAGSDDPPLHAHVNHGRWIVLCECGGAQFADPDDHRFFCVACWNHGTKRWRRVEWPPDRAGIERVLAARPPANRHWQPGETILDLEMENTMRGLPSEPGALILSPDGPVEKL